ncbi:MAG TPA: serine/threonine-protein kinase [Polyangiaceae bacterium]
MSFDAFQSPYPKRGDVIDGKYEVEQMLGEGGMGAVTKARHLLRRAPVALKFLSPSVLVTPGAVERFVNEAVAASQFESPHVVSIIDVGKLPNGAPYIVMEYLEGKDLAAILEEKGTVEIPRAIHFVLQVLRGLQAAHAEGIIHRDMKPSNCFVIHRDGDDDFVKLFDFGISKIQREGETKSGSLTRTNSALGTPLYMSPEQAKSPRSVDIRTDLYSTAVILYELLTGWTPYFSEAGELTEILFKLFTQDPQPITKVRPDLPPALAEAIHKCLARDLDVRPSSAAEMAELLAPFADDRSKFVLDRIRHPPAPRRTGPPPKASEHGEGIAAFHKLSSAGSTGVSQGASTAANPAPMDRRAIGEAATQISLPPPENTSSAPPNAGPPSMAREGVPAGAAAASAQSELDATRSSALSATKALADSGEKPARSMGVMIGGAVLVLGAVGIGIWAIGHKTPETPTRDLAATTTTTAVPTATTTATEATTATTTSTETPSATASASASASATATHRATTAHPPPSGAGTGTTTPESTGITHLNDIGRKH